MSLFITGTQPNLRYTLRCDGCRAEHTRDNGSETAAIVDAYSHEWSREGNIDICPSCRRRRRTAVVREAVRKALEEDRAGRSAGPHQDPPRPRRSDEVAAADG